MTNNQHVRGMFFCCHLGAATWLTPHNVDEWPYNHCGIKLTVRLESIAAEIRARGFQRSSGRTVSALEDTSLVSLLLDGTPIGAELWLKSAEL